jgi:hypothetical protein
MDSSMLLAIEIFFLALLGGVVVAVSGVSFVVLRKLFKGQR